MLLKLTIKEENQVNYENVTIQDCLDNYEKKERVTIIENGQVVDFRKEE